MDKTIGLQGMFFESQTKDDNSTFHEVAIRVHGLGKNANGSNITEQAYEKAKETIKGIPIVAKFTEEVDIYGNDGDLTAHNQMIVKDKKTGGYTVKYDTVPLGFIHPDAVITTEDVEENDGRVRTYIKADKVILWKRYDATQKIIEWLENDIVPKVSMEIGSVNGQINDGYFQIDDFEYESICALGSDVMPCFDKAEIMQFENKDFNKLYQEMVDTYQDNIKEGGENVKKKDEDINVEETEKTFQNEEVKHETADNSEEVKSEEFALSNNNLEAEIRKVLSERQITITRWGDSWQEKEFYLRDVKNNIAIVIDNEWVSYYGIPFTVSGDIVTLDYDSKVEYVADWRPKTDSDETVSFSKDELTDRFETIKNKVEEKFASQNEEEKVDDEMEQFKKEFETLKDTVETLKATNEELSNYKASKEKEELKMEVDNKVSEFELEENEISEIREQAYNAEITIEQFEKELFALVGKKALEKRREFTSEKTETGVSMKVADNSATEEKPSKYGKYEKYLSKNNK